MTDSVVVDASLAIKWVKPEPYTAEAIALLTEGSNAEIEPVVPAWFAIEVSNVLYRQGLAITAPPHDAVNAFHGIMASVTPLVLDAANVARGVQIAAELNQPRTYDAVYAALAEREGCELWTADERFWRIANRRFSFVRWIGERAGMT
jgi:predicted nucleic acid-binding protein